MPMVIMMAAMTGLIRPLYRLVDSGIAMAIQMAQVTELDMKLVRITLMAARTTMNMRGLTPVQNTPMVSPSQVETPMSPLARAVPSSSSAPINSSVLKGTAEMASL